MEYVLSIAFWPGWRLRRFIQNLRQAWNGLCAYFIPHARNNYHPHILSGRSLALFAGFLVSLKIFVLALLAFSPAPAFSLTLNSDEIIALTNLSRREFGLMGLKENWLLAKAAQAKAEDMSKRGYFSHHSPDDRTAWSFISEAGYNYMMAGENLAVNFTAAGALKEAWMNSPGHKANILNKNFEEIGIGISQGSFGGRAVNFVVQMFGLSAEEKISLSGQPTLVEGLNDIGPNVLGLSEPASAGLNGSAAETGTLPRALDIYDLQTQTGPDKLSLWARADDAVKVLAFFGPRAIWLKSSESGEWQGEIPISVLLQESQNLVIKAFDINGNSAARIVGGFSGSSEQNFNFLAGSTPIQARFLAWQFSPEPFAKAAFGLFAAGILACLILAILIKRHIQHLNLIVNGSFAAMLAVFLWLGG